MSIIQITRGIIVENVKRETKTVTVTEGKTYPVIGEQYTITDIRQDTPVVKILKFKPVEPTDITYKPGQFVNLYISRDGEKLNARPYSISSSPTDNDHYELTIRIAGLFTQKVDKLKVGDIVRLKGPFGRFVIDESAKELVLFAGGTGIAPFISMIRYIQTKKLPTKVILFYSNKTPDFIIHKQELDEMLKNNPNFKFVYTCTRETPNGWNGERGRFNADMIKRNMTFDDPTCMACGPNEMVDLITGILKDMNVPENKIIIERWG